MLFLDGVYIDDEDSEGGQRFVPVLNHLQSDITRLTHLICTRIARYLLRTGLIETDAEHSYVSEEGAVSSTNT